MSLFQSPADHGAGQAMPTHLQRVAVERCVVAAAVGGAGDDLKAQIVIAQSNGPGERRDALRTSKPSSPDPVAMLQAARHAGTNLRITGLDRSSTDDATPWTPLPGRKPAR